VGDLHQINSYANIIYAPLMYITFIPRNISNFLTSLSKIFEIIEENQEVQDIDLPLDIRIEGEVDVKGVTFGYESYNPVLEGVSFHVNPGEMIGIVGHSGCGKTTLINLLMRLYDVNEGAIEIDNVNIKDISQNALRSQIGVVLQETFLFSGTIRDNIKYAMPHATDEQVIEAARIAGVGDAAPAELCRRLIELGVRERVVVHMPEKGVTLRRGAEAAELPSIDIPSELILGKTGAGDAYCAGALTGIYRGLSDLEILELGGLAAIGALTQPGAVEGMKTEGELREYAGKFK
jgi:hypothetical protein